MNGLCPPSDYTPAPPPSPETLQSIVDKLETELKHYKRDAHYYFQKSRELEQQNQRLIYQNEKFREGIQELLKDPRLESPWDIKLEDLLQTVVARG